MDGYWTYQGGVRCTSCDFGEKQGKEDDIADEGAEKYVVGVALKKGVYRQYFDISISTSMQVHC